MVRSPFSGAETTEIWGSLRERPIYRCPDTGVLFLERDRQQRHDYEDFYPYLKEFDARRFAWELKIRRGHYKRQLARMRPLTTGNVLLDVGAGPGYLVRVAVDEGWDAAGVEVATDAVHAGQSYFGVRYVALGDVPDVSVDAITCHHVLEHLVEPAEFLAAAHRKLRPGGLLVVHVPHQQPLSLMLVDRLERAVRRRSLETRCSLYGDVHISGFTGRSLQALLERCLFRTLFVRTAGLWSSFYDPFFLRNHVRSRSWRSMAIKFTRGVIDDIGAPIGLGDWVVGYFVRP